MSNAYIGEIRAFGFSFATVNWAFCDGQLMPISQQQALFSVIGTTYGGDGVSTFALPNMQDRAPMDWGNGANLTPRTIGEVLGTNNVTLTVPQMPGHNHMLVTAAPAAADDSTDTPSNTAWLGQSVGGQMYTDNTATPNTAFASNAIGLSGMSMPHNNVQPMLGLNFCICLQGIYPSRG